MATSPKNKIIEKIKEVVLPKQKKEEQPIVEEQKGYNPDLPSGKQREFR